MLREQVVKARAIWRAFGSTGLLRRTLYEVRLRSGAVRRQTPPSGWPAESTIAWRHRFDIDAIRAGYADLVEEGLDVDAVVDRAERVLSGEIELYGWAWKPVGWPPRWHANTFTGHEYPRVHWTRISDDDPAAGDIKDVWELSRLPFTYLFARAWILTDDERYPEAWWQAIEDWADINPPNLGVNWRCGQETSLRGIALCFGLSVFSDHPASTPQRRELAAQVLQAHVDRVRPTLGYALSQRNNHAISELVFLISLLGPQRRLCRLLHEVLDDQFYPDGSYSQQSFNYQRLAVQALQWLLLTREDLPPRLRVRIIDAVARSRDFLARCSDPVSGWLPNYGANDGALLFHLDDTDHRDFRPFLTALGLRAKDEPRFGAALWLRVDEVAAHRTDAAERPSTYLTLRGPRSLLLTRAGSHGHRAGHADQLAVDLWIDGHNVVKDPGSYRYTAPAPWGNALTGIEVHSTVRAVDESVMRLSRFLSEPLHDGHLVARAVSGVDGEALLLKREAQGGLVRRALVREGDRYVVIDHADGTDAEVRWNMAQADGRNRMLAPPGLSSTSDPSEDDPTSGWISEHYAQRGPEPVTLQPITDGSVAVAGFRPEGAGWLLTRDVAAALDGTVGADIVRRGLALLSEGDGRH